MVQEKSGYRVKFVNVMLYHIWYKKYWVKIPWRYRLKKHRLEFVNDVLHGTNALKKEKITGGFPV